LPVMYFLESQVIFFTRSMALLWYILSKWDMDGGNIYKANKEEGVA
jgi:hypothetical protein